MKDTLAEDCTPKLWCLSLLDLKPYSPFLEKGEYNVFVNVTIGSVRFMPDG